uniref:Uncharacterized protein n=1 Tax=viral metagenome TaxID=1070528 RepID=A0A6C0EE32_9ZZZZ
MAHYYEMNIVEIKNEYTDFLANIISPLIYEGLKSIYATAILYDKKYVEASKNNPEIANPGTLKIFQLFLKEIPNWGTTHLEKEMIRIRDNSKHADIFDNLVKAVIKSNIILLTFNSSGKKCKLVNEKFHEKIDVKLFIHKCYVECARHIYNYPELFWHEYETIEIKRNQRELMNLIKTCIIEAIRKMLPMKDILTEYLRNDYVVEEDKESKIRSMLLNEDNDEGGRNRILESDTDDDELNNMENDLKTLIMNTRNDTTEHPAQSQPAENKNEDKSIFIQSKEPTTNIENPRPVVENEDDKIENNILQEHKDNTEEELKRKIQSGEYTLDLDGKKKKIERVPTFKIMNEHNVEPRKNQEIEIVKDKIPLNEKDREVFFNTMLNQ